MAWPRHALPHIVALILLATACMCGAARCQTPSPTPRHEGVGVYVLAIHAIDTPGGTFNADMWIWSTGRSPRSPLDAMEFTNANQITRRLQSTTQRGDLFWHQVKVVGTFRQVWDLTRFPFDTQNLLIELEEGTYDATAQVYDHDGATGFLPEAAPQGWRITGLSTHSDIRHYATSFGDPDLGKGGSDYSHVTVTVTLQRTSIATFLNLAAPLYAAFLLCTVSFLLHQNRRATVDARVTLLAGALFAVVLNMRAVSSFLGNEHHLTVVDRLNMAVLAYIVLGTFVTVGAGMAHNANRPFPHWLDYACGAGIVLSFVALNLYLLPGPT